MEEHDSLKKIKILGKYYTKESTSSQMWVGKVTQGDRHGDIIIPFMDLRNERNKKDTKDVIRRQVIT